MASPPRRGRSVTITLEHEAVDILRNLAQSGRSYGKIISILLRQEEWRRFEARRLRNSQAWSEHIPETLAGEAARAVG
jgi:hypothetical protein